MNPQLQGGGGDECPSPVRAARKVWELREQMSAQATQHRRVSSAVHTELMTIDTEVLENNINCLCRGSVRAFACGDLHACMPCRKALMCVYLHMEAEASN